MADFEATLEYLDYVERLRVALSSLKVRASRTEAIKNSWLVTIMFYGLVHHIKALCMWNNITIPEHHTGHPDKDTGKWVDGLNDVAKKILDPSVSPEYLALYNASRNCRYSAQFALEITIENVSQYHNQYKRVARSISRQLKQPASNQSLLPS